MDISLGFLVLEYYEERNKMKDFFDYTNNIYCAATKSKARIKNNFKFFDTSNEVIHQSVCVWNRLLFRKLLKVRFWET